MKTLIAFTEPIGLAWLGITALLVMMAWRRAKGWLALLSIPWLLMTLLLCTPVPSVLLASLERPWVKVDLDSLPKADAIISLGGTGEPSKNELVGFHFTRGADRLMTSVELARRGKAEALLFGGGGYPTDNGWSSEADAAKKWIDSWAVLKQPVISLGVCADTHDEALKSAALIKERGWKSVILVTSASHMTRAEAVFKKAGVTVTCAPCNLLSTVLRERRLDWFHAPHPAGMESFSVWFHEWIGTIVYRHRGWL